MSEKMSTVPMNMDNFTSNGVTSHSLTYKGKPNPSLLQSNGVSNGATNGVASNGFANGASSNGHGVTNGTNGCTNGMNGHTTNGHQTTPNCCTLEQNSDDLFQDGCDFLKQIASMCLNEGIENKVDRNSKVVEYLSPEEMQKSLDLKLENDPVSRVRLMDVCRDVLKYSVKTGHPHFFNQLFGGMDPYGLSGAWMTEFLNTSQYTFEVGPVFTIMEKILFTEMCKLFNFGDGEGIFCPGGSMSNMYGLNLARYRAFPEVKTKGLRNLPEMCVATSEKGHYSLKKGVALLGIGMDNLLLVKTDKRGKMIPADLDRVLTDAKAEGKVPIMVNATAGNTVLGAYDPLTPIADVCKKHDVWLHVDAAWGGGIIFSEKLRYKMEGIDRADSLTWNPHKMLMAPLQASMFLTKHKELLKNCHAANARYLFQQDKFYDVSYDTGDKSLQCGRKVDVLKVWIMWKAKGTRGFAAHVEHLFHCSQYLTSKLAARNDFRLVLEEPECTNVCFWYIPPSLQGKQETEEWKQQLGKVAPKIKERMVMTGSLLIGYQPEGGRVNFFRFVVANANVKLEDMDFVIDEVSRLGQDL